MDTVGPHLLLALLSLCLQFVGAFLWDNQRYRWLSGLLIASGSVALASVGGHWAFGSVRYFWSLQWL